MRFAADPLEVEQTVIAGAIETGDSRERPLDARVTAATEFRRTSRGEEGAMADVRVIATGLRFPEGPVAMADGSVILGEIAGSAVTRVAPDGSKSAIGSAGGGPNGLARGPHRALYLCYNGGHEYAQGGVLSPRPA